jgi:hypothetical protein
MLKKEVYVAVNFSLELLNNLCMFSNCETGNLDNANWLIDRIVNITSSAKV